MDASLREQSVAIVGVGALGSSIAELLVRGGVNDIILIDGDDIAVGNLVRHTLTVREVGAQKAHAVATRLNAASPFARVTAHASSFPLDPSEGAALLERSKLVVDCTGSDAFLRALARCEWSEPKRFASISTGRRAVRSYFFACQGTSFAFDAFRRLVDPWLDVEAREVEPEDEPWGGAGCWHPLFPARADDVALHSAAGVKLLESAARVELTDPILRVLAQRTTHDGFAGLEFVRLEEREQSQ